MSVFNAAPWKDHLRRERIQRNWRQSDVAEALETSVVTIQRWEKGSQQPSAFFRIKLCTLFGKRAEDLGLADPSPLAPVAGDVAASTCPADVSAAQVRALWNVPHPRNPHFTGREDLLSLLQERLRLQVQQSGETTRHAIQIHALKGLGGVGKTQIAVEYAYRAAEQGQYEHIFWLNAASEEATLASFIALGRLLLLSSQTDETNQPQLAAAVKNWLEECEQPWLLIVDNADEPATLGNLLPRRGRGSVLLTTRTHAVGALASSLEVETMSQREGLKLLLRRAQRPEINAEERIAAMLVVKALDGFPLALDQAGAYIEESGCGFATYQQLYQRHRQRLLARRGKQTASYPCSVATTWLLSFEQVKQTNPAAAELLRLCSFLDSDRIPEELLIESAQHWPATLREAVSDPLVFNQMVEILLTFSLVKRLAHEGTLSVHRLVQAVLRDAMDGEEQSQWAERVVRGVATIFPSLPRPREDIASWPSCLRYLEQAQACDRLIQQYHLFFPEAGDLLYCAGIYLLAHASYDLAERFLQRAISIREETLEPGHPDLATVLNGLATLYNAQGKGAKAELLLQQALQIWEQLEHPDAAHALNNLAISYRQQGKHKEAEPLLQRALRISEQQLGPEHPDIAYALNNLAISYRQQGKHKEAEPLLQRSLRIKEQQLGPEHPLTAYALNNLANLYSEQGRNAEAEQCCQRALRVWEQQFGSEHPELGYPLNNLAELYGMQGKYREAELLYQRALFIREKGLGPEHPDVALSLNGLANLYLREGHYTTAAPLYQRALHICEHARGPLHFRTAEILYGLASLYKAQGDLQEAMTLYSRVLAIREQVFGLHHPKAQEAQTALATLLQASKQEPYDSFSR